MLGLVSICQFVAFVMTHEAAMILAVEHRCSNILSQTPWIYEVKTVQGELRAVLVAALNATTSTFSTSRQQQVNSLTT